MHQKMTGHHNILKIDIIKPVIAIMTLHHRTISLNATLDDVIY